VIDRREMLLWSASSIIPMCTRIGTAAPDMVSTNVYAEGEKSADYRLGKPKTLNDYFPFAVPKTKEAWAKRRQEIREQLLVANGLWPMPPKPALDAVVHGKVEKDGYTIEKVYFRSTPGHYVTGNLYRPLGKAEGKRPAVLFAHGHWKDGRFHDDGEAAATASVKSKAEADMDRGRFFMQAIPVQLARMGFVVFQYDMVGYADSTAVPHIARSGVPHANGFADAQGELRLQSLMGLQTLNSVRCLDFLETLPDVDMTKVGITGASGGGTQTFLLAAIDDRVAAAFPAVMVSTAMQGGCVCENCSLLRVNTGNIELAAAFAPKPQALSAAKDWTHEIMTKGFPELKQLYKLVGAEDKVAAKAWLEYGHNYNQHAREFMYSWFNEHLAGKPGEVKEKAFPPTLPKDLSVFDSSHPRPVDEGDAAKVRAAMTKISDEQIAVLVPTDEKSLANFRKVLGPALRAMVNDEVPERIEVRRGPTENKLPEGATMHKAVHGRIDEQDAVPSVIVYIAKIPDKTVLWLHPRGKASLFADGKLAAPVKTLLDAGFAVVAPDLLGVGEQTPEKGFEVNSIYSGFTYGYNRSLLANRVHDVLTMVGFAKMLKSKTIHIVGWDEFGPVAVLAKALAGSAITKTAADLNKFQFETITKADDPMLLPGALKYGGLGAFLALAAPDPVLVHNHSGTGEWSKAAYAAAKAEKAIKRVPEKMKPEDVVAWLVG